jgi:hypothetical protein
VRISSSEGNSNRRNAERARKIRVLKITIPYFHGELESLTSLFVDAPNVKALSLTLGDYWGESPDSKVWDGFFKSVVSLSITSRGGTIRAFKINELAYRNLAHFYYDSGAPVTDKSTEEDISEFLIAGRDRLRTVSLTFKSWLSDAFVGQQFQLPKARSLHVVGQWCNPTGKRDVSERLVPLQAAYESQLRHLDELSIARFPPRSTSDQERSLFAGIFDASNSTAISLTKLKLGVVFDLTTDFLEWLAGFIPRLHTLWISQAAFRVKTFKAVLERVGSLNEGALPLSDLLLKIDDDVEATIPEISLIFRHVYESRFLFETDINVFQERVHLDIVGINKVRISV